jgi:hypothetical protein
VCTLQGVGGSPNKIPFQLFVRYIGNFRYILIPDFINKFMTLMSDPVRAKHVQVFKLKLK